MAIECSLYLGLIYGRLSILLGACPTQICTGSRNPGLMGLLMLTDLKKPKDSVRKGFITPGRTFVK